MSDQAYVKSETHQSVTTIEFYHPQSNSLPSALLHQLAQEIGRAGSAFDTRVVVLRSAGTRAFCAGAAFEELAGITNEEEGKAFFSGFAHVINALRTCPKLVIGRIHGKCVGGALGLVAATDYAIAREGADIRLSELSIGIGPYVIAPAVERRIGNSALGQLSIDAMHWRSAEWAQRKGLYAELHPSTEAMDESVSRLAGNLAKFDPGAMAQLKQTLWEGTGNWGELLYERAAVTGRLAMSAYTKDAIARLRK